MPVLENVATKASRQVWASPDGQRKIYEVILDVNGEQLKVKTYSDAIAKDGFSGNIETYEKPGKQGSETFAKQQPKAGGYGGGYGGRNRTPESQFTMFMSYAKDLVVAQIAQGAKLDLDRAIQLVIGGAHELYNSRPEANQAETTEKTEAEKSTGGEQITLEDDPFAGMETLGKDDVY